jgi:hypothetical protein
VSTTRFADATTALLAAYRAAAPLAAVTITDGPAPSAGTDMEFILVGHDGSLDPTGALATVAQGGSVAQEWLEFPAVKSETGSINCVLVSQSGDTADLPGRRARAAALLAACEDAAIAAGDVGGVLFDGTTGAQILYRQSGQGCAVMCVFTVGYSVPW